MIRTGLVASAACIAASLAAWVWLAQTLPLNATHLPVHWNAAGVANRFVSRGEALRELAMIPVFAFVLAVVFTIIPAIDPLRPNVQRSGRAYLASWIGVQAALALAAIGVAVMTVRSAGGDIADSRTFVRVVFGAMGLLFVFLGDALPKTRPNFFVGVRTPWTLTSDLSWEKTHRLTGRLMVLIGLWIMVASFLLRGAQLTIALTAPLLAMAAIAVIYSFLVWRSDPARRRAAEDA